MSILRGSLLEICIDTSFLVIGLASVAIAGLRRRGGVRLFLWLGIWSASYGLLHLLDVSAVDAALPPGLRAASPYVRTVIVYAVLVVAGCAWLELTKGAMRRAVIGLLVMGALTATAGIAWFIATGVNDRFMRLNNLLAAVFLLMLLVTLLNKRLSEEYLLLPERGFLVVGTLVFTLEALCVNLTRPLFGFHTPVLFDHLGFLLLLVAFGYSGLKMVLTNEHRLTEIQAEMEVARQIQASILPTEVPQVEHLRISATYRPMAAVAGDFYEFVPVDRRHAGFLVADVCGHGVPAALIASMLKVAAQSAAAFPDKPGELMATLNRTLSGPLRGQLVSAAYLWVDMDARKALYSAAGHPPLLRWNHYLERIDSNGLLFGVLPDGEYPVREVTLHPGDRLLLYTDGVTEPENSAGEAFGDCQLQRVFTRNGNEAPNELAARMMAEVQAWHGEPELPDDATLIVIDVT